MNAVHRLVSNGVVVEKVIFVRATMNEAPEIYANLIEDITEYDKIVVDLSFCDYIDSSFFGALIMGYRRLKAAGGSLVVMLSQSFHNKCFIYKDISSIFKVFNSLKEAIQAVNNPFKKDITEEENNNIERTEPDKIVQTQLMTNPKPFV